MIGAFIQTLRKTWWYAVFVACIALLFSMVSFDGTLYLSDILGYFVNLAGSAFGYAFIFAIGDGVISFIRSKTQRGYDLGLLKTRWFGYFNWFAVFTLLFVLIVWVPLQFAN